MSDLLQLKEYLEKNFQKYSHVAGRINRYPDWMIDFHYPRSTSSWSRVKYTDMDIQQKMAQQDNLIDEKRDHGVKALSCVAGYARASSIESPLVFFYKEHEDAENFAAGTLIKALETRNTKLLRTCHSFLNVYESACSMSYGDSLEQLYNAFEEQQKLLSEALFNAKLIKTATEIMLCFINQKKICEYKFQLLQCTSLEDMEQIETHPCLNPRTVTIDDLKDVMQTLKSRRTYLTCISDFFQEMLDDLADLIPILRSVVTVNRSTASLTMGLFNEFTEIEVSAVTDVDFTAIDSRINHHRPWQERYPAQTRIIIPKKCSAEIIDKLMMYEGITSVNGESVSMDRSCNPSNKFN